MEAKIREKKPAADDVAPPPRLRSIHEACETALREHVAAKRKCFVTGAPGVGKSYLASSHARRHRDTNGAHAFKEQLLALLKILIKTCLLKITMRHLTEATRRRRV